MKIPFVKEWGSWAVFACSSLAALLTGLQKRNVMEGSGSLTPALLTLAGMAFLINAKNPLTSVLRTRGDWKDHARWLALFSMSGLLMMAPVIMRDITVFLPCILMAAVYCVMIRSGKEHSLAAEYTGFALLALSAPIMYYALTGDVSSRLYAAVLLFFGAGVFKVRVRIRKSMAWRWAMAVYCAVTAALYALMGLSVLILLPMIENIIAVLFMHEEKLRTTGYIELTKGLVFVALLSVLWA